MSPSQNLASLIFVSDDMPGITRRLVRGKWAYRSVTGKSITDPQEIARLNAIALPPAYTDAWFAPAGNAHILATGYDARGRKQYRYHPHFRTHRDARKFDGCVEFAKMLPLIRQRVEKDLRSRTIRRDRAIASVVRLLDSGSIRVGNEAYARENKSFGATTLRMRHASVGAGVLKLSFRAKSGKQCVVQVTDRSLVRFVKAMQDLPGQQLFQYVDEEGSRCPVTSTDVNGYIRDTMGGDFTAKDFRTWAASVVGFTVMHTAQNDLSKQAVFQAVAERLGNTPAIARKSYVHPAVIAAIDNQAQLRGRTLPRKTAWLSRYERGLIEMLETESAILLLRSA